MPTYLTISVGSAARTAKAILASNDPRVIRAALDALVRRAAVMPVVSPDAPTTNDRDHCDGRDEALDQ